MTERAKEREVADAMRLEAVLLLRAYTRLDETTAQRVVDTIVAVAMLEVALAQAEALKHASTKDNP